MTKTGVGHTITTIYIVLMGRPQNQCSTYHITLFLKTIQMVF